MKRRLAAILAADIVGYSRLVERDEAGTLNRVNRLREQVLHPSIEENNGRIVKQMGDGFLVEFASVVDAVTCSIDWQRSVGEQEQDSDDKDRIRFRIGINVGDIIAEGNDIHGDGVNIAARLESLSEPGRIYLSSDAYRMVRGKLSANFEDLGDHNVKNLAEPVHVFRIASTSAGADTMELVKGSASPEKPSIAVLPFATMSAESEQDYFADGITEDLITMLSKVPALFVIARNSSFAYKDKATDVRQVAQDLGVRFVLEGSVRSAGNRVRVTAQLTDATTGHHRWAERYDRSIQDIFELQDEITREIVAAVDVELTEGDQIRVWRNSAGDVAAYEHFARGRDHFNQITPRAIAQAQDEFEKALTLNPNFAAAHAYVGWNHAVAGVWWARDREQEFRQARASAETALSIDTSLATAHAVLAFVALHSGEHDLAEHISAEAAASNPNSADSHNSLAIVRNFSGKPEKALVSARHALRLSPIIPYMLIELGRAFCELGRHEEALDPLRRLVSKVPHWVSARTLLIVNAVGLGTVEMAKRHAGELLKNSPNFRISRWSRTLPYKYPDDLERHLSALRSVDLPE